MDSTPKQKTMLTEDNEIRPNDDRNRRINKMLKKNSPIENDLKPPEKSDSNFDF
jgi:hypothetical protein